MSYIGCLSESGHIVIRLIGVAARPMIEIGLCDGTQLFGQVLCAADAGPVLSAAGPRRFLAGAADRIPPGPVRDLVVDCGAVRPVAVRVLIDGEPVPAADPLLGLEMLCPTDLVAVRAGFTFADKRHPDPWTVLCTAQNILQSRCFLARPGLIGYHVNAALVAVYKHAELAQFTIEPEDIANECLALLPQIPVRHGPNTSVREDPVLLRFSVLAAVMNYHAAAGQPLQATAAARKMLDPAHQPELIRQMHYFNLCKAGLYMALTQYFQGNSGAAVASCNAVIDYFYRSAQYRTENVSWFSELKIHHDCALAALKLRARLGKDGAVPPALLRDVLRLALRLPVTGDLLERTRAGLDGADQR